jgi:hypothetical protein
MAVGPFKKRLLVDQHAATNLSDYPIETVRLGIKYQVAKPTLWWPSMEAIPVCDRD